jgi:alkylation response protein AidB-like acyl-CoA dehydrogenase
MQRKDNFFSDNEDIAFQLKRRMDFEALFSGLTREEREATNCQTAEEFKGMILTVLETLGEICGSVLAPNAVQVEKEDLVLKDGEVILPPTLSENMRALLDFGCSTLGASTEYGGLATPFLFEMAANEMIMRACPSTGLNIVWYSGVGHIIEKFGSQAIKERIMPKIVSGEWSGCMALTEPDAGSDLGNLRTYAEAQPDGSVKLYGSKRFISNGCGQIALVLAMREKGATGLGNINLYLCLRKGEDGSDNYRVTKLEEKVALHGSATCELAFDGSRAVLLGEDGKGFQHMLHLMNDARIAVGFQGLGLMEAVWRMAADYASQRKSWGKPIAQHELIAEKLLDMEVEVRAVRSLCYQAGLSQSLMYQGERALKANKQWSDEERAAFDKRLSKHRKRVRRWTPLIKWYVGERAPEVARTGLNIHGGYGFTKEYRAEWWMRESLILALYEGTSQIQALMCVKDTLKSVIRRPTQFIETALGLKVQKLRTKDPLKKRLYEAKQLEAGAVIAILLKLLKANVRATISEVKPSDLLRMVKLLARELVKMQNVGPALLHAERLTQMKSIIALGECLYWDGEVEPSRRWMAERWLAKALPRLEALKKEIEYDDDALSQRLYGADFRASDDGAGLREAAP